MLTMPVMKKPLNALENPVPLNIKKGPPRFMNSRKHWTVGEEVLNGNNGTIPENMLRADAVLVQSRDSSRIKYGVSSHRDYINETFRPPIERMEDREPLSRMPRGIVWGRVNPEVAFEPNNSTLSEMDKYFTNRIKDTRVNPEFSMEMGGPVGKPITQHRYRPEIPKHMVVSHNFARVDTPVLQTVQLEKKMVDISGYAGVTSVVAGGSVEAPLGHEDLVYGDKKSAYGLSGGEYDYRAHLKAAPEMRIADKTRVAGTAGVSVEYEAFSDIGITMMKHKQAPTAESLARVEIGYTPDTEKLFISSREKVQSAGPSGSSGKESVYKDNAFRMTQNRKEKHSALQQMGCRNTPEGMGRGRSLDSPMGISVVTKKLK